MRGLLFFGIAREQSFRALKYILKYKVKYRNSIRLAVVAVFVLAVCVTTEFIVDPVIFVVSIEFCICCIYFLTMFSHFDIHFVVPNEGFVAEPD